MMKFLTTTALRRPEDGGGSAPPDDSSLRETLAFDPSTFFAPQAKEGSGAGEGEGDPVGDAAPDGEHQDPGAGASTKAPGSTPPSPKPDPAKEEGEEEDPLEVLRASVKDLLTKKPDQEATPQPAPKAPEQAPQAPAKGPDAGSTYEFNIPMEIVDALGAEEPATRQKAVGALMSGLANKLAKDFGSAMAEMAKQVREQAVAAALEGVQTRSSEETVRKDFYDAFPDLKELTGSLPALDSAIWTTVSQVAQATGVKAWSPEFRDQVGNMIRLQMKLPTTAKPTPAPTKQPRRAAFAAGGSAGGGRPNGAADPQSDFLAVLGAGS